MTIEQGEIYWIDLGQPSGSEPGYIHPYVVIQNDVLNSSQIRTVIVCALTTNLIPFCKSDERLSENLDPPKSPFLRGTL